MHKISPYARNDRVALVGHLADFSLRLKWRVALVAVAEWPAVANRRAGCHLDQREILGVTKQKISPYARNDRVALGAVVRWPLTRTTVLTVIPTNGRDLSGASLKGWPCARFLPTVEMTRRYWSVVG